jgi:hypothetical protein
LPHRRAGRRQTGLPADRKSLPWWLAYTARINYLFHSVEGMMTTITLTLEDYGHSVTLDSPDD